MFTSAKALLMACLLLCFFSTNASNVPTPNSGTSKVYMYTKAEVRTIHGTTQLYTNVHAYTHSERNFVHDCQLDLLKSLIRQEYPRNVVTLKYDNIRDGFASEDAAIAYRSVEMSNAHARNCKSVILNLTSALAR